MSTPDKCPYCGTKHAEVAPAGFYLCGSSVGIMFRQSDLCRERAAHAETRKELEMEKQNFNAIKKQLDAMHVRAEKAESRVRELEGLAIGNQEAGEGGLWIEVFIPTEHLGGADCEGEECPTLGEAMPRMENTP